MSHPVSILFGGSLIALAIDPVIGTVAAALIAGGFGTVGVLLAGRFSGRAAATAASANAEVDQRKVDQETFDRVTRELRTSLAEERAEREWIEHRCYQLEDAMRSAGIAVPAPLPRPAPIQNPGATS